MLVNILYMEHFGHITYNTYNMNRIFNKLWAVSCINRYFLFLEQNYVFALTPCLYFVVQANSSKAIRNSNHLLGCPATDLRINIGLHDHLVASPTHQ